MFSQSCRRRPRHSSGVRAGQALVHGQGSTLTA